ncbi:MAG: 3-dehydroquinate synthase [Coriobacteriia bacterium]|nr:3-dehydroquinate synthase [Coriobacteriia bacterium]
MSGAVVHVAVPGGAYEVRVGPGELDRLGDSARAVFDRSSCALVTDSRVAPLYADRAELSLRSVGLDVIRLTVPAGERTKDWARAGRLLESMSDAGLGRDAFVVALGGGVVGDLAGFCASVYLRGLPVIQVPTTLLAQVDSAIGGKTGVDLPRGKNLVGSFWQPALVVSDTDLLSTLPEVEWRSGLAEVAKSAFLASDEAVRGLEADATDLLAREATAVARAVAMSAGLKAEVVSGDERESADRECLNLGHTLAHALERELGYGTITHGAAVAEGLRFAAAVSERVAGVTPGWGRRQGDLLDSLGLESAGAACGLADLLGAMGSDKKVRAGRIRFVLSTGPGAWCVEPVDGDVLSDLLEVYCQESTGGER